MDPIVPPFERCPQCGHHEMSHKFDQKKRTFACIVFECQCEWTGDLGGQR